MATGATVSLRHLGTHPDMMHKASKCTACGTVFDTFITSCECDKKGGTLDKKRTEPINIKYVGSLSRHILSSIRIGIRLEHS